jgi:hypothetical protein
VKRILSVTTQQLWDPFPDTSYLEQPEFRDRYQHFRNGDFSFIGIQAEAKILVNGVCPTITSGGLWNIESDSDRRYLSEVEQEEIDHLKAILHSLGFSQEAIKRSLPNWRPSPDKGHVKPPKSN